MTIVFNHVHLNMKAGWHLTPSVLQHDLTFLVVRGRRPTPFEKLIMPFDDATWCLVIASMVIGYSTILVIYQFPRNVQEVLFHHRHPSLGLSQIFFGIGMINTPQRLFPRFLFIIFTFYCLVIRTAYQGKMFDFLHFHVRKPGYNTVQEVLDSGIDIYNFAYGLAQSQMKEL